MSREDLQRLLWTIYVLGFNDGHYSYPDNHVGTYNTKKVDYAVDKIMEKTNG